MTSNRGRLAALTAAIITTSGLAACSSAQADDVCGISLAEISAITGWAAESVQVSEHDGLAAAFGHPPTFCRYTFGEDSPVEDSTSPFFHAGPTIRSIAIDDIEPGSENTWFDSEYGNSVEHEWAHPEWGEYGHVLELDYGAIAKFSAHGRLWYVQFESNRVMNPMTEEDAVFALETAVAIADHIHSTP